MINLAGDETARALPIELSIDDDPELRSRMGRYLGGVRKTKLKSQEQISKAIGISRAHLSNIELGRARSGWPGLRKISAHVDAPSSFEVHEGEKPKPPRPAQWQTFQSDFHEVRKKLLIAAFDCLSDTEQRRFLSELMQAAQRVVGN